MGAKKVPQKGVLRSTIVPIYSITRGSYNYEKVPPVRKCLKSVIISQQIQCQICVMEKTTLLHFLPESGLCAGGASVIIWIVVLVIVQVPPQTQVVYHVYRSQRGRR